MTTSSELTFKNLVGAGAKSRPGYVTIRPVKGQLQFMFG